MTDPTNPTPARKLDHLRICAGNQVESGNPGWNDIKLVHHALPECDMDRIDSGTKFLGHELSSPLYIAAMTGGHRELLEVNATLAGAAERYGLGMGVGSQRAALENPVLEESFSVVREHAPSAFLVANLGVVQLRDHGIEWAERAVEMIDADAIAIHLNFLQEAIQPEGDHDAQGCLTALGELCRAFKYPVIVKETGCGISARTASMCFGAGVQAIDIGGWGGTSWAIIESIRAEEGRDSGLAALGQEFAAWGIPTVVSLSDVARLGGPVIATGGIRSGLDMARAIALGADLCGVALPLLKSALKGEQPLCDIIERYHHGLRVAMFLTGSRTVSELKSAEMYITGNTREMFENISEEYHGY
ncbi:MAG: type 2 isopentenyl-diphosphate Delta-isomerase [Methanoregulaceae archaeon]|nr:type 2 isopentenyl-diphosphate Delta-isomerase [Methanoregulaceae archaeon]